MVKTTYYDTNDRVPATGIYSTFCDNALATLNEGARFPECPTCHLSASWRPANLIESAESTTTTAKREA
jgi:hypothetical protein